MELTKQNADTFDTAGANPSEGAPAFPWQQDLLAAGEYFDNLRGRAQLEPEKELLLAVLQDGIQCFRDNLHARSEEKTALCQEARAWIFCNDWAGSSLSSRFVTCSIWIPSISARRSGSVRSAARI